MNVTNALDNSDYGHTGTGFIKTTILRQLQFHLGVAALRAQNPRNQVPVWDAAVEAAMGDNGLPQQRQLDVDELTDAAAAGFVLLARHIKTPNPDDGKREEFLIRYLQTPKQIVQRAVDFAVNSQLTQARATAAQLGATIPEDKIRADAEARFSNTEAIEGMQRSFTEALKTYNDQDDDVLVDVCLEALTNADSTSPEQLVRSAAKNFLEMQKKRMEAGLFTKVDSGIYSIAHSA